MSERSSNPAGNPAGTDVETDHDYDGIREFDNPLPKWWLFTLYGSIVFGVCYWFYYHTLGAGLLPAAELAEEMAQAQAAEDARLAQQEAQGKGVNEEALAALVKDGEAVGRGAAVFKQNCVACHGDRGQGLVGPNLTDAYWIHGTKLKDNYRIIAGGVLDKGMPAWKTMLGMSKVRDVAAYVISLRDTNAPGKPPQGLRADGQAAPGTPASGAAPAPAPAPGSAPAPAAAPAAQAPASAPAPATGGTP